MAAKIFRINYKSDFILTLNSDAGWMTPFCIKFWTGAPSRAFYAGWDGTTYTNCAPVAGEPTKLTVQFDDHHLPVGDLKLQIAYHFTAADFPNDTEDEVINPADITTMIDGEEYQVMLDFTGETAPEIQFSLPAYANEAQRIANEQERQREFAQMQEENAQAVEGAENVNATLNGTVLTVTNRNGQSTSVNTKGEPGIGVPTGGSTGQVLAKRSDNNYETEWVDQQGGGDSSQADWAQNDPSAPDYIKNKPSVYTKQQTDEAIEQAKEDVSWTTEMYDVITEADGSRFGTVSHPRGRVVYFSSIGVSEIRISPLPHRASTGISFKVIGTPTEDTNNFVQISARGFIIFRTSNKPTVFKAGVTYEVEYTYISHDNLGCVYLESWVGGVSTAAYTGSYNDLSDKPNIPTVPTNVSAFTNDAGYVTKTVNDLVNYYLKADVYTKTEVANLISAIQQFHYEIYASISAVTSPAGNVLYLIGPTGTGADKYEEYVYDSTKQEPWVKIGDTSIDLSDYYTKGQTDNAITSALNTALADYTTTAALTLLLAGKQDVINDLSDIRSGAAAGATAYQKPHGGIPSTDMSQSVQDSLDLADTALQEDALYYDANGHDYVEIGGMKWATKNIGADAVTDAGLYFQWGDTQGYTAEQVGVDKDFTWADYKFSSDAQGSSMTKYNSTDGKTVLELEDDAARANWGGTWRMPTTEEMQAFGAAVNAVWTDNYQGSGVAGLVCTDKTDNTKVVFFPAAGNCFDGSVEDVDSFGYYWSSSLYTDYRQNAFNLYFDSYGASWDDGNLRYYGFAVRPILDTTQLKKDLDKKQDTLVSGTNIKTINNESILGGGNINIDISGKEDVTTIVAPVNATDATLPITTLATEVGKYYRLDVPVETLAVTLPAMTDLTTVRTVVIYLTAGTTPAITISSSDNKDVYYQDGYEIEADNTYEINALFNGAAWVVAAVNIVVPEIEEEEGGE